LSSYTGRSPRPTCQSASRRTSRRDRAVGRRHLCRSGGNAEGILRTPNKCTSPAREGFPARVLGFGPAPPLLACGRRGAAAELKSARSDDRRRIQMRAALMFIEMAASAYLKDMMLSASAQPEDSDSPKP
jgi:hypothetical protein